MNFEDFIKENAGHAHHRALKEFYYQLISDALRITKGNNTKAAELLGLNRETMRKWRDVAGVEHD